MLKKTCVRLLTALIAIASVPAVARDAPRLTRAQSLADDRGAVLISIRSQQIYSEKLRVWFAPEGIEVPNEENLVMFERVQGFGGPAMLRSMPRTYELAPGKYRLFAHMVGCGETLPPAGTSCVLAYQIDPSHPIPLPTYRYEGDVPTFSVEAGKLTDAGEFVLEFEPGPSADTLNIDPSVARIRWKPITSGIPAQFSQLSLAQSPIIPASYSSRITCENPGGGLIKPTILPFAC